MGILDDLFGDPSGFKGRPYAWLTNQIAHTWLGSILVLIVSSLWFYGYGEYPVKEYALAVIAAGYITFELRVHGWCGWDTVEDSLFVLLYGAAGALLIFTEVAPGDPDLTFNPAAGLMVALAFIFNLLIGVITRQWGAK